MTPTRRSDLVEAVNTAWEIVTDAIPNSLQNPREALAMRAAALPVILREILDVEVEDDRKEDG